jgi:hypothetical protein
MHFNDVIVKTLWYYVANDICINFKSIIINITVYYYNNMIIHLIKMIFFLYIYMDIILYII